MVEKSQRRSENLATLQRFLQDLSIYGVDEQTAQIYGQLKSDISNYFAPTIFFPRILDVTNQFKAGRQLSQSERLTVERGFFEGFRIFASGHCREEPDEFPRRW